MTHFHPMRRAVLIAGFVLLCLGASAQTPALDLSVQVQATAFTQPPAIQLDWVPSNAATAYTIYRKAPAATSWGAQYASLPATQNSFLDTAVSVGMVYEYRVLRSGNPTGNGYITAAIQRPIVEDRGILILAVDFQMYQDPAFASVLDMAAETMDCDGWRVRKLLVDPTWPVTQVKDSIVAIYQAAPGDVKALYLIGDIPVPYSGNINPDGHPDHLGAWPADVYYAELDGAWGDMSISNTTAADPRHHNVPADGKFDPNVLPSATELIVGRVDFGNLPAFSADPLQLTTAYLEKSIAYKRHAFEAVDRALVDDNFTGYAEGFAASGYRAFTPLVGADSLDDGLDFFAGSSVNGGQSYLWGYGCGAGWYTSCAGVGTTANFASDTLNLVFSMLFGSYFGDWDSQDNILRAALAQGWTLSSAWAGRPHWVFHPMGLGEPLGHCAKLTQNNSTTYQVSTLNSFGRWIHIALLGDPTLRMHYLAPASGLQVQDLGFAQLNWVASPDAVLGYHVYRRHSDSARYERLSALPVAGTSFMDSTFLRPAAYTYMVKAVALDTTASGTYFNQSLGSKVQASFAVNLAPPAHARMQVYPNPSTGLYRVMSNGQQGELHVCDLTGKTILALAFSASAVLDLSALPAGMYLLKGDFGIGGQACQRILKQ